MRCFVAPPCHAAGCNKHTWFWAPRAAIDRSDARLCSVQRADVYTVLSLVLRCLSAQVQTKSELAACKRH